MANTKQQKFRDKDSSGKIASNMATVSATSIDKTPKPENGRKFVKKAKPCANNNFVRQTSLPEKALKVQVAKGGEATSEVVRSKSRPR